MWRFFFVPAGEGISCEESGGSGAVVLQTVTAVMMVENMRVHFYCVPWREERCYHNANESCCWWLRKVLMWSPRVENSSHSNLPSVCWSPFECGAIFESIVLATRITCHVNDTLNRIIIKTYAIHSLSVCVHAVSIPTAFGDKWRVNTFSPSSIPLCELESKAYNISTFTQSLYSISLCFLFHSPRRLMYMAIAKCMQPI